jgi:large subunit ribosomal protein L9
MKVILLEDIENLGLAGKICEVKDGYARNFLFPKKLALAATKENVKLIEEKRNSIIKRTQKRLQTEQAKKEQLDGLVVEIKAKAGEGGKLFGSIGAPDIYAALKEKQIEVDLFSYASRTFKIQPNSSACDWQHSPSAFENKIQRPGPTSTTK